MPFAGFINKPDEETIFEFTKNNFISCTQNILISITSEALKPITFITSTLQELFDEFFTALQMIRVMIANIRKNTENIAKEILSRILNVTVPLRVLLLTLIDTMSKIQGILTAALYTSLAAFLSLQSVLGVMANFIVLFLMVMVGIIAGMWLMPFTWPMAISSTALFVALSIPMALILNFLTRVLGVRTEYSLPVLRPVPKLCFDGFTILRLQCGKEIFIKDMKPGDVLFDQKTRITSVIKIAYRKEVDMYKLLCGKNTILVSGSHLMFHNGNWIPVSNLNFERIEYNEKFLYCLSTSTKQLPIDSFLFADWDDVPTWNETFPSPSPSSGFEINTRIDCFSTQKTIQDIQIGDLLDTDNIVYGIVQMEGMKYHLLTSKTFLTISGRTFLDFDTSMENFYFSKN